MIEIALQSIFEMTFWISFSDNSNIYVFLMLAMIVFSHLSWDLHGSQ